MAAELALHMARSPADREARARVARKAKADVARINRDAEFIRHMTELYQERLDGGKRVEH